MSIASAIRRPLVRSCGKIVAEMPGAAINSPGRLNLSRRSNVDSVTQAEKTCSRCTIVRSITEFYAASRNSDGRMGHCRICHAEKRREQYQENPEKILSSMRARRARNRDAERKRDRVRYASNREAGRALRRASYAAHAEARKQQVMAYRRANPLKVALIEQKRRAQRAGNPGGVTSTEWLELCARYGNRCLACGRSDVPLTIDHVVPLSRGGLHMISQVQPLCKPCNSSKGTKTIDYRPAEVTPCPS